MAAAFIILRYNAAVFSQMYNRNADAAYVDIL